MYFLYADDTNNSGNKTKVFLYGGILVAASKVESLHKDIQSIRDKYGYPTQAALKFDINSRPKEITPEVHRNIKREIIASCIKHDVSGHFETVPHEVAGLDKLRLYSVGGTLSLFNRLLEGEKACGMAIFDRFQKNKKSEVESDLEKILEDYFTVGARYPDGTTKRFSRIIGCHITSINMSNMASAADIVLGGMRYVVNYYTLSEGHEESAKAVIQEMIPLFVRDPKNRVLVNIKPKELYQAVYDRTYKPMIDGFAKHGIEFSSVPRIKV